MCGYIRWLWTAQGYSNYIFLYPLQVLCHIMCRTKQQWVTVVNSWRYKIRYKCGSCCTCQESTIRCQTTQFKVACPNISISSHSKSDSLSLLYILISNGATTLAETCILSKYPKCFLKTSINLPRWLIYTSKSQSEIPLDSFSIR